MNCRNFLSLALLLIVSLKILEQEDGVIFPLPNTFGVPAAKKAIKAHGFYIVSSMEVDNTALNNAYEIVKTMLDKIKENKVDFLIDMISKKSCVILLGINEDQSKYWTGSSGRRSATSQPDENGKVTSITAEETLVLMNNVAVDARTLCHEFSHLLQMCLMTYNKLEYDETVAIYQAERINHPEFYHPYDIQNEWEFWAGNSTRFWNINLNNLNVLNAGVLTQRETLQQYSNAIYQIYNELYAQSSFPALSTSPTGTSIPAGVRKN